MQDTELVVTATLCLARYGSLGEAKSRQASGGFHISTKNSYPAFAGTLVLVCGQYIIRTYFNPF